MSQTPVDFNKMNVAQLKSELKQRGLETDGKKTDFVARLNKFEKEKAEAEAEAAAAAEAEAEAEEEQEEEETEEMATEDIVNKIDEITGDKQENGDENGDEEMEEDSKEGDEEKTEEDEDKAEEDDKKKEKKDEGPDYTLNAKEGFVLALSSGRKVVIPDRDIINKDLKASVNPKTVVVFPITIEDLGDCNLQEFFEGCLHFKVVFQENSNLKEKSNQGYVEFVWASQEQATEQAELMSQIRDGLTIKHLTLKDKIDDLELPRETTVNSDVLLKRFLYIGNLPPTATEQALQELFPDAVRLSVIFNEEGLPKGYALAEMANEDACDRATKMYMNVEFEDYTLVVLRAWTKPPKGLLDAATRTDLLGQVKKLRLKLRGKTMMNAFTRRKIDNETAAIKQRLDKDCKLREELSLPVPPDVVRREELLKEIEEKKKEEKEKNKDKPASATTDKKTTPAKKTFSRNSNSVPYKRPMTTGGAGGNRGRNFMRGGSRGGYGNQGYGNQGYRSGGYGGGSSGQFFNQGASGGGGGGGEDYGQAVEMLMQVSKMLGQGAPGGGRAQQSYGGSGYGSTGSGAYGGSGYGNSSFSSTSNVSGGYGYGSGTQQRTGAKRLAEDDGFSGGKRGSGYKNQRRW